MREIAFSSNATKLKPSAICEAIKTGLRPDVISFAVGNPAPETFPVEQLRQCYDHVLSQEWNVALQYSASEGYPPLREFIASWMKQQGVPVSADNVLITSGSTQALDLVLRVLLDPGSQVVVDDPLYGGTLHTLSASGVEYLPVRSDPTTGIDVSGVEDVLRHHTPKLIYTVPNFHNPLGSTIPAEQRPRLAAMSGASGVPLLEDDPYRTLYFDDTPPPQPIKSFDNSGTVIYLGSFSKVLAPGIRLGWLIASGDVLDRLIMMKQATDMMTSGLTQMVAYEFCRRGWLEPQLERSRARYQQRRDVTIEAMEKHFPPGVRWSVPKGGMFLWVTLPDGCDTEALLLKAITGGVVYLPGAAFSVRRDEKGCSACQNSLRLNFSNAVLETIPEGIARLGRVIKMLPEE
ncbi:MAG: aminotransferase-like domain-containing protein [Chloroflexota bacterium]